MRQTRRETREARLGYLDYVGMSRDPNVKMVLFEDSAALIGIVLAAPGIGLQAITGVEIWDPLASIAIGVLLVFVAFWMARDARYMLVDGAAPGRAPRPRRALADFPEVAQVRELLTLTPNAPGRRPHRPRRRSRRRPGRERLRRDRLPPARGRPRRHRGLHRRHPSPTPTAFAVIVAMRR